MYLSITQGYVGLLFIESLTKSIQISSRYLCNTVKYNLKCYHILIDKYSYLNILK